MHSSFTFIKYWTKNIEKVKAFQEDESKLFYDLCRKYVIILKYSPFTFIQYSTENKEKPKLF